MSANLLTMDTNLLMKHKVGGVHVYAAESVEILVNYWKAKHAVTLTELECAKKDIELQDREIAALKRKLNMLNVTDVLDVQILESGIKAEGIREAVQCAGSFWSSDIGDLIVRHDTLLEYADKLEAGDDS